MIRRDAVGVRGNRRDGQQAANQKTDGAVPSANGDESAPGVVETSTDGGGPPGCPRPRRSHRLRLAARKRLANPMRRRVDADRRTIDDRAMRYQHQRLKPRLDELDRLMASEVETRSTVTDARQFLSRLEFTLRKGLPQEKLAALRQCVDRIHVNKPAAEANITIRTIPTGNLEAVQVIRATLEAI